MQPSRRLIAIALLVAALPAGSATAVTSLKSTYGADFSQNSTSGKSLTVYDKTADNADVARDYVKTGSDTRELSFQTNGGKGTYATTGLPVVVYKHRVVQLIQYAPDHYGNWRFPN